MNPDKRLLRSQPVGAFLLQCAAGPPRSRAGPRRSYEGQEVVRGWNQPTGESQPVERRQALRDWRQHRDRVAAIGHFERFATDDPRQIYAQVLS